LPEYRGQGFASESTAKVLEYGIRVLGLPRIVAIAVRDNAASNAILRKVGMRFERIVRLPNDETDLNFYAFEG
jgi:RimJ/RimL family protein N-acetyltransferase